MKSLFLLIFLFNANACSAVDLASASNKDKQAKWHYLFNGENLNNWTVKIHQHETGINYADTFRAEDGMIKVRYDKYTTFNDQFGHIYYNTPFSNFHLSLEYRFSGNFMEDAPYFAELNSGVMFYSQSPNTMPKMQNWPISVEMQFLASLGDGKARPTGNMCSPGTDIHYQGKVFPHHCLSSSSQTFAKDAWVTAELIVNNGGITHLINGEVVLKYTHPVMKKTGTVKGYEPEVFQSGKPLTSGYIALQSEGQPIEFKNIKIKKL